MHSVVFWFVNRRLSRPPKNTRYNLPGSALTITFGVITQLKNTKKVSARPQIEHPIEKQFRASVSQENTQQGQFHSKEMSQIEKYISSHTGLNLLSNYSQDWLTKTQLSISFTTKKGVWARY